MYEFRDRRNKEEAAHVLYLVAFEAQSMIMVKAIMFLLMCAAFAVGGRWCWCRGVGGTTFGGKVCC